MIGWRPLIVALGLAVAELLRTHWTIGWWPIVLRTVTLALVRTLDFGLAAQT